MPFSLVHRHQHFGIIYWLHLQAKRWRQ